MMSMVMSVISQDPDLTLEEAAEMAANARRAALSMFPDKELAYDLIYRPAPAAADERTLPAAIAAPRPAVTGSNRSNLAGTPKRTVLSCSGPSLSR